MKILTHTAAKSDRWPVGGLEHLAKVLGATTMTAKPQKVTREVIVIHKDEIWKIKDLLPDPGVMLGEPVTAKPEPEQTDEELAAEFMSWPKEGMNYAYEIRIAGTREIEAKLAEEGLAQAYADALYGQTDKLPRDNDHRIALLEMEIELLLTAKDLERLRAIGAVLRGRGGK